MKIKSYKLFDWLEKSDLEKIKNDLEEHKRYPLEYENPEIGFYVEELEKDFVVSIHKMIIRSFQYHLYGRVISGLHEGYDVHIQYDSVKKAGELTVK